MPDLKSHEEDVPLRGMRMTLCSRDHTHVSIVTSHITWMPHIVSYATEWEGGRETYFSSQYYALHQLAFRKTRSANAPLLC